MPALPADALPSRRAPSQMVDSTFITPYNATENAAPPPPKDICSALVFVTLLGRAPAFMTFK